MGIHSVKSRKENPAQSSPDLGLWIVIIIGLVIRLFIAWQPVPSLIEKNLPDDSYYYFSIARNTIDHGSISVDGIHTTNGFHPLWWILLLPIFSLNFVTVDIPIHIVLSLSAILDSFVILFIWMIAQKLTRSHQASFFAALCYAINPVAVYQGTNGLETSLVQLCIVLFWWLLIGWMDNPWEIKSMFLTGIAGGFMLLARNDTIFFFGFGLFAWLLLTGIKSSWKLAIGSLSIAIFLNLPWYIFSRWLLNSWVQDSGLAVPYAIQQRWIENNGADVVPRLIEAARQILLSPYWLRGDFTGLPLFFGVGLWFIVLVILGYYWVRAHDIKSMAVIIPPVLAGVALIFFHSGIRWYPRPWYFVIFSIAWPVAAALAITISRNPIRNLNIAVPLMAVYFIITGYLFWQIGFYPWQKDFLKTSYWIKENVPVGTRIGSFNSGIYSYYSGRVVINLDGVVNHEAFLAVQQKNILSMLHEKGVKYLVDSDMALGEEYGPFLGGDLEQEANEIVVFGKENSWAIGPIRVYKLKTSE